MISIVTITYNNFEELKTTLNSIPDFNFIESVVINGGDERDVIDWLQRYEGIVLNEKDNGIADAFNKGVKNSSGSAVMFLNSGDLLINKEYLVEAEKILDKEYIDYVHSNIIFQDSIGINLLMKPQMKSIGRGMPFLHPTMIVKRKVFDEIGEFDTQYKIAMDFDFTARLIKKDCRGCYLDIDPVVMMDGKGKSTANEFTAIVECAQSLKRNRLLSIRNISGLSIRTLFFLLRKLMNIIGAKKILRIIKAKKYSY